MKSLLHFSIFLVNAKFNNKVHLKKEEQITDCLYGNFVNFHIRVIIHWCWKKTLEIAIQTNGRKTSKTSPSFWGCGPHLIHPSLDQPHSPPQMASRSNQPFFFHNSPPDRLTDWQIKRPTDRPTDGIGDNSVPSASYALLIENDANNNSEQRQYLLSVSMRRCSLST